MEDKSEYKTVSAMLLLIAAAALLIILAFDIAEKNLPPKTSTTTDTDTTTTTDSTTDTYYEIGRKFSIATRLEGGCNYVVVRSMDGVAITPALNQPETCNRCKDAHF